MIREEIKTHNRFKELEDSDTTTAEIMSSTNEQDQNAQVQEDDQWEQIIMKIDYGAADT